MISLFMSLFILLTFSRKSVNKIKFILWEAIMEKEKIQVEKQAYEKPILTKHGRLKDLTTRAGSVKTIE